ncbi:hypothetical protein [Massilia glaciei]|nr:hypothetical protein [Massilia glaciei]
MRKVLAILVAALTCAGAVHAQEAEPKQTVQGAHRFFEELAKARLLKVDFYDAHYKQWNVKDQAHHELPGVPKTFFKWSYNSSAIKSFKPQPTNQCLSKIQYEKQIAPHLPRDEQATWIHYIDWSDVKSVDAPGNSIRIQNLTNELNPVGFTFPTRELTLRAQYAAEFLKFNCDKLPVTGF